MSSDSEEIIEEVLKHKNNAKNNNNNKIMTTKGVKENTQEYKNNKNIATLCDYCNNFYDKRMIAVSEFGDTMCQHCYFFLNFSMPEPKYGWTLEKYVELCSGEHDKTKCERLANGACCHLCLYLMDIETQKNKTNTNINSTKKNSDEKMRQIDFCDKASKKVSVNSNDMMIVL
jgi:hypothetical protein